MKNGTFFEIQKDSYSGLRRLYKITYKNGNVISRILVDNNNSVLLPVPNDTYFDKKQLERGIEVELEHTNDKDTAKIITKHHLLEDKNYYKKLRFIHKD